MPQAIPVKRSTESARMGSTTPPSKMKRLEDGFRLGCAAEALS
jgi:hypothetical protein